MTEWNGTPPILHLHVPLALLPEDRTLTPLRRFVQQAFGATLHLRPSPDPVFDLTLWGPWSHSPAQVQSLIAPLVDVSFHEGGSLEDRRPSTGAGRPK
ncbi:hypothetical protein [Deinococcus malanensis]|nr:hypothetical protein [Deinococcus malanensis]